MELGGAPGGWTRVRETPREVAFRHPDTEAVLEAVRGEEVAPTSPMAHAWELYVRQRVEADLVRERVARLPTRSAAVECLLECLEVLRDPDGYVPPRALARRLDTSGRHEATPRLAPPTDLSDRRAGERPTDAESAEGPPAR